jgi:uncharacterized membrane protein YphA (DoxX/SURF4 family)
LLRLVLGSLFVLIGLGKFNGDPHGMWYHVFARIGFGQWFRVATGIIQLTGGTLFVLPGTCRIGGAMLAGTMLGAMLAQLTVLGNPLVVFIPGALFAAVIVVALRDPTLDATIATLEARKARRKL